MPVSMFDDLQSPSVGTLAVMHSKDDDLASTTSPKSSAKKKEKSCIIEMKDVSDVKSAGICFLIRSLLRIR